VGKKEVLMESQRKDQKYHNKPQLVPWKLGVQYCLKVHPRTSISEKRGLFPHPERVRVIPSRTGMILAEEITLEGQGEIDEATGERSYRIIMPSSLEEEGGYPRLVIRRYLTLRYDLATVVDSQGNELTPVFRSPKKDRKVGRLVIPAGAVEWYVGMGMHVVAVNARGRVTVMRYWLEEIEAEKKLRIKRLYDGVIPMLAKLLSTSYGTRLLAEKLGTASEFLDEVSRVFCWVTREERGRGKNERPDEYFLSLMKERIRQRMVKPQKESAYQELMMDEAVFSSEQAPEESIPGLERFIEEAFTTGEEDAGEEEAIAKNVK
jgi:hypothetical protein